MDMVAPITRKITPMNIPNLTEEKVKKILRKMKNKKAAGPDELKPELYKTIANDKKCLEIVTKCLQNETEEKNKPEKWKKSKTKMIKKVKKPTLKDLRPIALTNASYKISMVLMKDEIEEHLERNMEMKEHKQGSQKEEE
ncbi:uncharacterized protein [Palaemon carinicauda]|uniref:uncharacterized protein n=1 Tax=Palaemon carinicauda TaxID=392227 RepID=UPI0035B580BF